MYKLKNLTIIVCIMLLFVMLTSCGKKNTEVTETESDMETTEEATIITFPDETGFYAHGSYNAVEEDPFATASVETTEATQPKPTESKANESESKNPTQPSSTKPTDPTEPSSSKPTDVTEPSPTKPTDSTEPTATDPTESTEKKEPETPTTEETTVPTEPEASKPSEDSGIMTYEKYCALSPAEQMAFFNTFESAEAFTNWYQNAKAEYEGQKNSVNVDGGIADLGDFVK